jgi:Flp pilus assembly protein TadD
MGDSYESIADTGKVLKLEPDNLPALELRGNSYYVIGEFETAQNHYRQALKFDPEHKGAKGGHRLVKKLTGFLKKAAAAETEGRHEAAIGQC